MVFDPFKPYKCNYLTLDFAKEEWEIKDYWKLRTDVFVREQGIFERHDRDTIDLNAIPIIAKCECMGMSDSVVGVVRIDEREPEVWWGSRLAVGANYRSHSRFNTRKLFGNNPETLFTLSVGASLIFKAVSTANYLGCKQFFAHVQAQNVKLFERLHWKKIKEVELFGHLHALMEADLDYYPASAFVDIAKQKSA